MLGFVNISAPTADFLDRFSRSEQNLLIILFGSVWLASGLGLLWLGRYLFRGLRFLFGLRFDRMRRFAPGVRGKLRRENRDVPHQHDGPIPWAT